MFGFEASRQCSVPEETPIQSRKSPRRHLAFRRPANLSGAGPPVGAKRDRFAFALRAKAQLGPGPGAEFECGRHGENHGDDDNGTKPRLNGPAPQMNRSFPFEWYVVLDLNRASRSTNPRAGLPSV